MRSTTRRFAAVLSVSALALPLSACSDSSDTASQPVTASPSVDVSASGTSEDATPTPDPTASPAVAAFLQRMKAGVGDRGSAHVVMRLTGTVATTATGDLAYRPSGTELALNLSLPALGGADVQLRAVDDKVYMALEGITPAGRFFEVPKDSKLLRQLSAGGLNPTASFAAIDAGLEQAKKLGTARIDGVPTDHYRLRVNTVRALAAMGTQPVDGLPKTLVAEAWLDAQDHVRRLTYRLAGNTLTLNLSDWGKPVSVSAPTVSQLVDAPPGI